ARYGIPSSNPFVNDPGTRKEIWALGLRHHQVISFDIAGAQRMFIGNIGQAEVESIYVGAPGANYGWPYREGRFVSDRQSETQLYQVAAPEIDASRGYTYPAAQYDHGDGIALAGGYVYRGDNIPALYGHYICGDIASGRVFHFNVDTWVSHTTVGLEELTLLRS